MVDWALRSEDAAAAVDVEALWFQEEISCLLFCWWDPAG